MNVLISGATGFVGGALCRALHNQGHHFGVLSRKPERARERLPQLSGVWAWQPHEQPPAEAFEGVDAVVHLAGEPVAGRWTARKRQAIEQSRVEGTQQLISAMAALPQPPKRLVSMSGVGHYGPRGDDLLSETEPPGDTFLSRVTIGWEAAALAAKEHGISAVAMRLGIVLGHNGGALEKMWLPFSLGAGGPLGSGTQWWSWIHMDDTVGAILFMLEHPELQGVFNLVAPTPTRQKEFAKALGQALGRPAFMPAPAPMLKLALGGFSAEILTSQRVSAKRLQDAGYAFAHPELEGALAHIVAQKRAPR